MKSFIFLFLNNLNATELLIIAIVLLAWLAPWIFYILTLTRTMNAISVENRQMAPANFWLLLVPLVSNVLHFIVVGKLAASLALEFQKRGITTHEAKPGYKLGLAASISFIGCFLPGNLSLVFGVSSLICWLIYWVKIAGYKKELVKKSADEFI
ncbi:MAG: hypothetical protein IPN76_26145 [Saprospiraceae bacterium]|nr:hypothetical protein [Saprospiraceae bacterium]